jgi:hypothetical protein
MVEDDDPVGPPPSQTKGDIAQAIARGAVSMVPFVGGPAAELIGLVLQPALEHRREEWLQDLASAIDEIRGRMDGFDPDQLAQNEVFITAVISASNAALRTHEAEKRVALRNAVISSALPLGLDEHEQLMFIRFVDELTALHLHLMGYLRDPPGWFERHGIDKPNIMSGSRASILEHAMPELAGRGDLYNQAVGELVSRGLAQGGLSGLVTQQSLYTPLTTPFGNRFLDYISDRPDREDDR